MSHRHRNFGAIIWGTGLILLAALWFRSGGNENLTSTSIASDVTSWATGASRDFYAQSISYVLLFPGDPVFLKNEDGSFSQVGHVHNHFGPLGSEEWTHEAIVSLYDARLRDKFPDGFSLEVHQASTSLDKVLTTLLTPEKQQQIAGIIADDWSAHRDEVLLKLQPVIQSSLSRAARSIEAKLPQVMEARRPEFAKLADRYQTTLVKDEIVPLVRQEVLPIVQEEVRPVARELGKQLWDRVSLWSFTWRYLYDASPLPEKNALKSEFNRFLVEEVTPAIEARTDDFVAMTERIVSRVSRNEKVRAVVRDSLKRVASDPELQGIVWQVIQESVLQNAELHQNLTTYWESDEVREMLDLAATQFEPTARAIGDTIIGGRSEGVTAEFSRVLRTQILMKDRRWLVVVPKVVLDIELKAEHAADWNHLPQLTLVPAALPMNFPLQFEGKEQSPLTRSEVPSEVPKE